MELPALLLADSDLEFQQAAAGVLQGHYQVRCCTNGKEALSILRQLKPEVLVLDLMLPELDGISLLQIACDQGLCPKVLAVTSLVSPYVLETVARLGIEYVIRKPCDLTYLTVRVDDLSRRLHGPVSPADSMSHICDILHTLGLVTKHKGYRYLPVAVTAMAKRPDQSVTKELYPAVAAQFETQPEYVERSIRSALNVAWKNRDPQTWEQYFPTNKSRCPSNAVFISRLTEELP